MPNKSSVRSTRQKRRRRNLRFLAILILLAAGSSMLVHADTDKPNDTEIEEGQDIDNDSSDIPNVPEIKEETQPQLQQPKQKEVGGIVMRVIDAETSAPIQNAKFNVLYNGNIITTSVSNSSGVCKIEGLELGNYQLQQIQTAKGYSLGPLTNISIINANKDHPVTIKNKQHKSKLQITSIDKITKSPIQGVEFTIKNSSGKIITTGTTDKFGVVEFELSKGKYIYQETKVPEHVIINKEAVPFQMTDDENVHKVEIINAKETGEVTLKILDNNSTKPLESIEVAIINVEDNTTIVKEKTNKEGLVKFTLPVGSYSYRLDNLPEKYETVETDNTFNIEEANQVLETTTYCKTLEKESNLFVKITSSIAVILVIILGCIGFVGYTNKRKPTKKNKKKQSSSKKEISKVTDKDKEKDSVKVVEEDIVKDLNSEESTTTKLVNDSSEANIKQESLIGNTEIMCTEKDNTLIDIENKEPIKKVEDKESTVDSQNINNTTVDKPTHVVNEKPVELSIDIEDPK